MDKPNKTNKPVQVDFIDDTYNRFVIEVEDFRQCANALVDLTNMGLGNSSGSLSSWLIILQSRLTALKKDFQEIQLKQKQCLTKKQ